jgi:O-antigen/teichoic acid export membrane protein
MNLRKLNYAVMDQVLISGTNFMISLILARAMVPAEYGFYIFAFTLMVLAVGLLNNAVTNPLNVLGAAIPLERKNTYIFNMFVMYLAVAGILCIAFLLTGFFLKWSTNPANGSIIMTVGLILFFYLGHEFFRNALLTSLKVGQVFLIDTLAYGLRICVIGSSISVGLGLSCKQVIWVYGLTSLLAAFHGAYLVRFSTNELLDVTMLKETWAYAKWTLADWVPFILSSQLNVYIVTFVLTSAATGVMGACSNLIAPLSIVLMGFMNFALPYYSRLYANQGEAKLKRSLALLFGFLIGGVIVYLILINLFATKILHLLFGKFEQYNYLVMIISLGIFVNYLFKPAEVYLRVIRKPQYIFMARCLAAAVGAVCCYPLVKFMGLEGAAWNYMLAQSAMCLGLYGWKVIDSRKNRLNSEDFSEDT